MDFQTFFFFIKYYKQNLNRNGIYMQKVLFPVRKIDYTCLKSYYFIYLLLHTLFKVFNFSKYKEKLMRL